MHSPSCCFKPAWLTFFCGTQNIFWIMFWWPLTSIVWTKHTKTFPHRTPLAFETFFIYNIHCSKKLKEHFENTSDLNGEKYHAGYIQYILIWTGYSVRNERMPHCLMEMKLINLQRAEFKDTPKIKVKKWCSRLVHCAEISLQQLKIVLSLYGPHMLVYMPDNVWACS